ncbi:alpha/beta hydrolase [Pseudomonas sp. N040]|uniref:alpha/beta hydrolase n=1 Tax=Pseudomonas sp. N040 TaxID=2785325 RepID=UPI0018A33958|nr:alpha/beta hydrolase [Pseudomonas sp. N040]MBF7730029.1 alpha/beta hydrolase [Pseudomonas sp. N040]MBW7013671.1 alpha/beta hydrolase [Pseudomonas sp. N040]
MPEAFAPDLLRASLRPLLADPHEPEQAMAYREFYRLQFAAAVDSRLGWIAAAGYRLAVQAWWPARPRATLVLLHGYYDHVGLYRHLIEWALGMEFVVLTCDLPGHGLSSGTPASINDFAEYQAVLKALLELAEVLQLPQPWHLFGQSTGGAILLDYLLTGAPRPQIGETILLAPLVRPRAWWRSRLGYRLLKPFAESIPRHFYANSSDAQFIDFVQSRDPLQARTLPVAWVGALARWIPRIEAAPRSARSPLIVQGDADLTVDWQHNLRVLQDKFSQPPVCLLAGGRHHLANEAPALRARYLAFLAARLG